MSTLSINGDRLWASLMELAAIGATPAGGVCRLALTDLDRQGRDKVIGWAREAGCTIRIDQIGNIFARRFGRENDAPAVASGSHIDTQPTGGKFDGNYGVLAVLEVFRTLNDHDIQTRLPLEMAIWTNEEGSRFVPVMMGSGVYAGAFTLETALAAVDREGISVEAALTAIGYAGDTAAAVSAGAPLFAAYFEAHIEQGPVLEDADIAIGAVTGALGQRWYDITVTGQEAHAGPTPMALRRDALQAATRLMQETVAVALRHAPHGRHGRRVPELAQCDPGPREVHRRLAQHRRRNAVEDGRRDSRSLCRSGCRDPDQGRHRTGRVLPADRLRTASCRRRAPGRADARL